MNLQREQELREQCKHCKGTGETTATYSNGKKPTKHKCWACDGSGWLYRDSKLLLIGGVEGDCIALNDYRIAGPKPWGGGSTKEEWTVPIRDILTAIKPVIDDIKAQATTDGRREGAEALHKLILKTWADGRMLTNKQKDWPEAIDQALADYKKELDKEDS